MDNILTTINDFFTKDMLRKLIALFFALLVWISVKNTIGVEKVLQEKIQVTFSLPPDLVMSNMIAQKVRLKVRASERLLSKLNHESFTINIPIKQAQYKRNEPLNIIVAPSDVTAPLGVTVVAVEEARVTAHLDQIISKRVKVVEQFTGSQAGYTTGKVTLIPSEVTITGPSNSLELKQSISTEPIPLTHMMENFQFEAKLAPTKSIISTSKSTVLAKVEILKSVDSTTINNIPIRILNSSMNSEKFDIKLDQELVNVDISGAKSEVELVKSDQVKAFLDISSLNEPGSYKVYVDCSISRSKAMIKDITPAVIKVTITEK